MVYSLQLDNKITTDNKGYQLKQAIQEHGLTSFNLQILAYCSIQELAEKEQYYLDIYQPEYNISEENEEDQLITDNSQLSTSIVEYNVFAKQLVLFQPPNQQLTSINSSPSLSLIP